MPAQSKSQQKYIYSLRGKYKSEEDTPDKFKWIWDNDWEQSEKNLPEKVTEGFSDWVLESFGLLDLNEEKVESNLVKDYIKICNRNIYIEDKDKSFKAVEALKEIDKITQLTLTDETNHKQFDPATLVRDARQINKNIIACEKLAIEIKKLQQRMESIYEDTAFKLSKYFEI